MGRNKRHRNLVKMKSIKNTQAAKEIKKIFMKTHRAGNGGDGKSWTEYDQNTNHIIAYSNAGRNTTHRDEGTEETEEMTEEWDEEEAAMAAMEAEIEEIARQEAHEETQGGEPDAEEEGNPSEATRVAGAAPRLIEEQKERIHRHKMEAIRILDERVAEKEREAGRKKAEDENNRVEGGGKKVKLMAISMNVNG